MMYGMSLLVIVRLFSRSEVEKLASDATPEKEPRAKKSRCVYFTFIVELFRTKFISKFL